MAFLRRRRGRSPYWWRYNPYTNLFYNPYYGLYYDPEEGRYYDPYYGDDPYYGPRYDPYYGVYRPPIGPPVKHAETTSPTGRLQRPEEHTGSRSRLREIADRMEELNKRLAARLQERAASVTQS